jgi:hypothetical protein
MKRPNPLSADMMSAAERRAELCRLLAVGLVRLRQRNIVQISDAKGESSLHNSPGQSVHATPTNKVIA